MKSADEVTRGYFDELFIEARHLDAVMPTADTVIFGHRFSTPVMLAALSHLNNTYPNGMVEAAKACAAVGVVMWSGMGGNEELEAICAAGAKTIKIIKPYADNDLVLQKIKHARDCGCIAAGMDIDHQFGSPNDWGEVLKFPVSPKTTAELRRFAEFSEIPFIVKGVLSETDAYKCAEAGAGGVVVSHHHGLVPCAVPPLAMLPKIKKAVGDKFPIFIDCGFETGEDVFKALALGATAVSIGRTAMDALKKDGAKSLADYFKNVTNGLLWTMAVTGSTSPDTIDPLVIHKRF